MMIYGAIEAGGTKFVCAVGTEELTILERVSFPTTTPVETMKQVIIFLNLLRNNWQASGSAALVQLIFNANQRVSVISHQHQNLLGKISIL